MLDIVLSSLIMLVPILLNIAFFTLLERKILGLAQSRKGPNKVGMGGVLQPFADAVKLFLNHATLPLESNYFMFLIMPPLSFCLVCVLWGSFPSIISGGMFSMSLLLLLLVLSVGVYPLLLSGWSSNSGYALVGAIRGVAQSISYEICLALFFMSLLLMVPDMSLVNMLWDEKSVFSVIIPVIVLLAVVCVAETNRTPFDFSEGESELVSGFNVEYGSGGFALIFMAEYGTIMYFSVLLGHLVAPSAAIAKWGVGLLLMSWWVWIRATYPRYRYDLLMFVAWCTLLPSSLIILLGFTGAI